MSSLPTWALLSIAVAAMLSPVLAFLMAIAVEIVIGALVDAGVLPVFAVLTACAIGWLSLRKLWVRQHRSPAVEI